MERLLLISNIGEDSQNTYCKRIDIPSFGDGFGYGLSNGNGGYLPGLDSLEEKGNGSGEGYEYGLAGDGYGSGAGYGFGVGDGYGHGYGIGCGPGYGYGFGYSNLSGY